MNVLITGAGGIIGRNLARMFAIAGHQVNATYHKAPPVLPDGPGEINVFPLRMEQGFNELPAADFIIHGAGHTHLTLNSVANDYVRANVVGMQNLVRWARQTKPKLVIFLSTIQVYGAVKTDILTEQTPMFAPVLYGASKYLGELVLEELTDTCPVVSCRLPGVIARDYFTPWIGKTAQKAAKSEPIAIFNPESKFNNIVDVEELYRMFTKMYEAPPAGYTSVNIAASEPMTLRETVETMITTLNSKSKIEVRPASQGSFSISTTKLEEILGFPPATSKQILLRYLEQNRAALLG